LDTTKYPSNMIRTIIGGFWNNWKAETEVITVNKTSSYLDSKVKTDPSLTNDPRILLTTEQRNKYLYILQKYYIDQGRPIFANVNLRQYYGEKEAATATQSTDPIGDSSGSSGASDPTTGPGRSSLVDLSKSPMDQLVLLKQTIATYAGVPKNDDAKLMHYITPVQKFYENKYLPNKKQPTLSEINGYVLTVDDSNVPTNLKANFKNSLTSILDFWFTEPTTDSSSGTSGGTGGTDGTTNGPKRPDTWDDAEIQRIIGMIPWPPGSDDSPTYRKLFVTVGVKNTVSQFWPTWTAANRKITDTDLNSFLETNVPPGDRELYRTFLTRYFGGFNPSTTGIGGTTSGTGGTGGTSSTSGTTTGGSSGTTYGPNSGSSSSFGKNIWGPVFNGVGSPLFNRGLDGAPNNANYPLLMGGQSDEDSTRIDGVGIVSPSGAGLAGNLPSSGSLGSDPNSRFLFGARQPATGTTDPYRLMGRFSTSSYSSTRDPVPFLTDFSAFFK
jgi:hypothetical protein